MRTNLLTHTALVVVIIATGCGGKTHSARCEPSPPTVSTCFNAPSPPLEPNPCPYGEGVNMHYSLYGEVYLWHPSAPCKRKIHFNGDGPYDRVDSGIPCDSGERLTVLPAGACHVRGNTGEVLEIVYSSHRINEQALKNAGWHNCLNMQEREQELVPFLSAPDCP